MDNIYDKFIEHLKKEELKLNLKENNLEKHHILPLHSGGSKTGKIVICTSKNHTLAHYYRYLSFKQKGDLVAFKMRWNQKTGNTEISLLAVEKNKKLKNLFWDTEWQSKQGKKGGLVGGSKNTTLQQKARQKIGLKYGRLSETKNQSNNLKKLLSKTTIWFYEDSKENFKLKILPQKTFIDLILILEKASKKKSIDLLFIKLFMEKEKKCIIGNLFFLNYK